MNPTKTSFLTAAGVILATLSVVYGGYVREGLDQGHSFSHPALSDTTPGLEVSINQIPEDDFFRGLVTLLKQQYVEPITDERKLAIGAVKGMVDSLKDPRSNFMNADEFRAFTNATEGKYEGIGVDLAYDKWKPGPGTQIGAADVESLAVPRLKVVAVTPGGPADRAGVKPGDWVDSVDAHWVFNPEPVVEFRKAVLTLSPSATKLLSPDQLKTRQQSVETIGKSLKARLDTMIMPPKAKDMLTIGTNGALTIVWHRGDTMRSTTITRKESGVPEIEADSDAITVRFAEGAADKLKHAISGKTDVTLDLRNNSNGDFEAMEKCLAVVGPSGTYGYIHSDRAGKSHKFTIDNGNNRPPHMTILVDSSTAGAADIFATALANRHLATLNGTPSKDKSVVEVVALPDGSGYTLVTGEYVSKESPPKSIAVRSNEPPTPVAMRDYDGSVVAMGKSKGGNA